MRRVLLAVSFWLLALGFVNAQEAFYIYRNDGDFNGFFYDEVVEMRYSKIALDSVEHEQYVTYEVELADTTYRIPLAAIDSIGFQQPEIRFNPKVHFLKDGYCEYLQESTGGLTFANLPADKMIHVGDIVLGNPLDPCERPVWAGSVAMKVSDIYQDGDYTYVYGHEIEDFNEVFDQYITVEEIGVDQKGNIRRRIAGTDIGRLPHHIKNVDGKGEVTLIDFSGNVVRDWEEGTTKVDLTTEVGIKYKIRVAYNITWRRFMVKISHDLLLRAKPSFTLAINGSQEKTASDLITIPAIMFPATCPVFETNPLPELFIKWDGQIATTLNMPLVKMGIGDDVIFDNSNLFPISYSLHLAEDNNTESDLEQMLDLSLEAKLVGSVQAGIKFSADVRTASWMKKLLDANIGLYLYCGPKLGGQIRIAASSMDIGWHGASADMYTNLVNSYLNIALLSLDLEAKAKAKAVGQDPVERTFFNKNWSFMCDTVQFAPEFGETTIDTVGDDVIIKLHPKKKLFLGYSTVEIAICDATGHTSDWWHGTPDVIKTLGGWTISRDRSDSVYEYRLTKAEMEDLKARPYMVCPYVQCGPWGKFLAKYSAESFTPPIILDVENTHLEFAYNDSAKVEVTFKSNVLNKDKLGAYGRQFLYEYPLIEVLDSVQGRYKATFYAGYNNGLFDRETRTNVTLPYLYASADGRPYKRVYFTAHQQESPLPNLSAYMSGTMAFAHDDVTDEVNIGCTTAATATRQGKNVILVSGSMASSSEHTSDNQSFSCTIRRTGVDEDGFDLLECTNVTMERTWVETYLGIETTHTVLSAPSLSQYLNYKQFEGQPASGTCDMTSVYSDQTPRSSYNGVMIPSEANEMKLNIIIGKPAQ